MGRLFLTPFYCYVRRGRKRRSISEDNLRKLHHLLLLIAQDAESTMDQSDQFRPLPWVSARRYHQDRCVYNLLIAPLFRTNVVVTNLRVISTQNRRVIG